MSVSSLEEARAERLTAEITELYGLISAATYEFLVKVREFDEQALWAGPGLASCAHWLNWQCGIGLNAAREKVRVAHALAALPKISKAFRLGEISYSKVRAMTRVADAESEAYLLSVAQSGPASQIESLVRGYRRAVRLSESAEQQHESRAFHYYWDEDGSLVFKGRLPAEVGAMLLKALSSQTDQSGKDVSAETPDQVAEPAPISQRRADALAEMAETYLASGPAASSSADRYQVMLHISGAFPDKSARIEHGPGISAETSRRICCDTSLSTIVGDDGGETLSIGRKSRVIPPAMRRAMRARDKTCRFPGCTHTHFIDGHHIHHWSDGGETSLDNLVQLCRHHHRLVHEGGFVCRKNGQNKVEFRTPAGALVPETGKLRSRYRENVIPDLKELVEDRYIDRKTILPDWYGESMDLGLAVSHLWAIERSADSTACQTR
jgi:hypothetical protein